MSQKMKYYLMGMYSIPSFKTTKHPTPKVITPMDAKGKAKAQRKLYKKYRKDGYSVKEAMEKSQQHIPQETVKLPTNMMQQMMGLSAPLSTNVTQIPEVLDAADGSRPAIVSTMRFPKFGAKVVKSFIDYHCSIGFIHFYLFFDDPNDSAIQIAKTYSSTLVTVTVNNALLQSQWKECHSYSELAPFIHDEVQARQHLNCEIAMQLALSKSSTSTTSTTTSTGSTNRIPTERIDWLLHIDSDELFHTTELNVMSHFQTLWKDDVYQMTYLNHEGIPEENNTMHTEEEDDGIDYYKNTTLFRRHHLDVPLNSASRKCMQYWEERTQHGQYMLCYDNGKSVCRVIPEAYPASVHKWNLPENKSIKTALIDPRSLNLKNIRQCSDPCILHYVCCGLPWLKSKYEMLGNFQDAWFGGRLPIAPSFHLDARDAVLRGDVDSIWKSQVVFKDVEALKEHVEAGVLLRLYRPREILLGRKEPIRTETNDAVPRKKNSGITNGETKDNPEKTKKEKEKEKEKKNEFTYSKAWMMSQAVQNFL